jgi:hypothetical protein
MNFSISPAFEYVEMAMNWLWPVMLAGASFGLGYICGGCAQRG